MSTIASEQQALVTFEVVKWLGAHCSEHDHCEATCVACQATPQCCPRHPQVNGTYPGFDLGCQACMATRPGYETVGVVGEQVMSAEQAVHQLGVPHVRRRSGSQLRVPLNLLRRAR